MSLDLPRDRAKKERAFLVKEYFGDDGCVADQFFTGEAFSRIIPWIKGRIAETKNSQELRYRLFAPDGEEFRVNVSFTPVVTIG